MTDLLDAADAVIGVLERLGIPYSVGGSIASSFSGEPRASIDVDILVRLSRGQIPALAEALGDRFYADPDSLRRAVETCTSSNLIDHATGIKVDLFVAGTLLEALQLERRRQVEVQMHPPRKWFVHSPEDILLQKLWWYEQGGGASDRQWRDVLAIVAVQGDRLDRRYLIKTASQAGLMTLLERAFAEAGPIP